MALVQSLHRKQRMFNILWRVCCCNCAAGFSSLIWTTFFLLSFASPKHNICGWMREVDFFFFNSQTYGKRMTKCQIRYSYNYVAVKKLYPSKNQIAIITISCWSKVIGCFSSWTFFLIFEGRPACKVFTYFKFSFAKMW